MSDTVAEIKATITRVERAHKLLQKLECGKLTRVPQAVVVEAMFAAADAWGYALAERAIFNVTYTSFLPQGDIDVIFQKAFNKTLPKMRFRYAMSMDYVTSAFDGRLVATKLHHVTAHENNVLREIHLTGSAANSNKFLARLLAATRLYHAVLTKQLAAARLAPARVKFTLKALTDSHKVFTGTPKYTGGTVSGRWSWRDLASKMNHMDYVQAMENMSTGPWVPPPGYAEKDGKAGFYTGEGKYRRWVPYHVQKAQKAWQPIDYKAASFDSMYKGKPFISKTFADTVYTSKHQSTESWARDNGFHKIAEFGYVSIWRKKQNPWVGDAALRFPNYGATDNQVRYFCTGGRTYRRED